MSRNVTAIYRTYATADLVRRELEALGISRGYIHVVPDQERTAAAAGTTTDDSWLLDAIDDLHLPDEDARTYKHSVRQGDYVVSAEVDDDQVARVQQIMRRPEEEAHNLDTRHDEFRTAGDLPRREGYVADEDRLGVRDETVRDPYTRSYQRKGRLAPREF